MLCDRCLTAPSPKEDITLVRGRFLYDRSHNWFRLCHCPACGQVFLAEFRECQDWSGAWGGVDQMWTAWMPLTPQEVDEVDRVVPSEEMGREKLKYLSDLIHRRGRLVKDTDGAFFWSNDPYHAGDILTCC